jgi:hypothetical protein
MLPRNWLLEASTVIGGFPLESLHFLWFLASAEPCGNGV